MYNTSRYVAAFIAMLVTMSSSMSAQSVGDFGSLGTGNWGTTGANWVVCQTEGTWAGATAAGSAPTTSVNVWIRSGHTVTMEASSKNCKNLFVDSGATLTSAAAVGSPNYLTITGTTATINGTVGSATAGLGMNINPGTGGTLTITGTPESCTFSRLRPATNDGISLVIDCNMHFNYPASSTGSTLYLNSRDNFTCTINAGKTVTTVPGGYVAVGTTGVNDPGTGGNFTLNVYGTLTTGTNGNLNLRNTAGKTTTLNVHDGGIVNVGGAMVGPSATPGSISINVSNGGTINLDGAYASDLSKATFAIDGVVDCKNATARNFGTAIVGSTGKVRLADSLYPAGTVSLNAGSSIEYYGSSPITLPVLPETYENLTVNTTGGVSLVGSKIVNGILAVTEGKVNISANTLTAGAMSGGSSTAFIVADSSGTLKVANISTTQMTIPVGTSLSYNPVVLSNSGVVDTMTFRIRTVVEHDPVDSSKIVHRQWSITEGTPGGSNATVQFQWNQSDEASAFNRASNVVVGRYDGTAWTETNATVTGSDPYLAQISGVTSFSDFSVGNHQSFVVTLSKTVTSNGTGGGSWTDGSTWQGGVVPDSIDAVIIAGGDSVVITTPVWCQTLTVQSNAKLATGTAANTVTVGGNVTLQPGAWYYNNSSSVSLPGQTRTIDNASNYVHMGSGTVGASGNSSYGNLIMMRGTNGTTAGAPLLVNGDLIMNNTGNGATFRGASASTPSQTHTVMGNVYVNGGQWSAIDVGTDTTVALWNIKGNVVVTSANSRIGPFTSASARGLAIFNIDGDLTVANGARFQVGSSSTLGTGTGIFNLKGDFTLASDAATALNMNGPFAVNFIGTDTQRVTLGRTMLLGTAAATAFSLHDTVASGAIVLFNGGNRWGQTQGDTGSFVVNGSLAFVAGDTISGVQNFALGAGGRLSTVHPFGIGSGGNLQVNGSKSFNAGTVVLNGTVPQTVGDGGTNGPLSIKTLVINNPAGVTLSDSTVTDSLALVAGKLSLAGHSIGTWVASSAQNSSYVATDNGGVLFVYNTKNAKTLFPVGTTEAYAPVWITNSGTEDQYSVRVQSDTTLPESGARVKVKWHIGESIPGGSTLTLQFGWMPALESPLFTAARAANAKIFTFTDTTETGTGSYTTQFSTEPYSLTRGGITAIGTFAVGKFGAITSVGVEELMPNEFALFQNYPNPFNPSTTIRYDISQTSSVSLKIYDILGKEIATVVSAMQEPGRYAVSLDASGLSSGMYFYRIQAGSFVSVKKLMVTK